MIPSTGGRTGTRLPGLLRPSLGRLGIRTPPWELETSGTPTPCRTGPRRGRRGCRLQSCIGYIGALLSMHPQSRAWPPRLRPAGGEQNPLHSLGLSDLMRARLLGRTYTASRSLAVSGRECHSASSTLKHRKAHELNGCWLSQSTLPRNFPKMTREVAGPRLRPGCLAPEPQLCTFRSLSSPRAHAGGAGSHGCLLHARPSGGLQLALCLCGTRGL